MKSISVLIALMTVLIFSGCKKNEMETAEVSVYLQDAPAISYEKIKIELKGVSIYSQASGSWVTLTVNNGIYDILTLDSLHQAFLGKLKISGGDISQVQLEIGSQNTVTVAGIDHPLVLDASDLDKLKVKIENRLNSGSSYKLTIDFKAQESIDASGNVYKLKASLKISVKSI